MVEVVEEGIDTVTVAGSLVDVGGDVVVGLTVTLSLGICGEHAVSVYAITRKSKLTVRICNLLKKHGRLKNPGLL